MAVRPLLPHPRACHDDIRLARPEGGSALTANDMPIEGRDEWLGAVRRMA